MNQKLKIKKLEYLEVISKNYAILMQAGEIFMQRKEEILDTIAMTCAKSVDPACRKLVKDNTNAMHL